MRARSRARGWALQLLYAWEAREESSLRDMLNTFATERRIAPANRDYLRRVVDILDRYIPEVDRAIDGALTNWRIERLSRIDRNVLRIGAAEILYFDDVPPRVSIQEAISLAEKYGTHESPRFVNGVLDAIMRDANAGPAPEGMKSPAGEQR